VTIDMRRNTCGASIVLLVVWAGYQPGLEGCKLHLPATNKAAITTHKINWLVLI
jgi:hypothetical protein